MQLFCICVAEHCHVVDLAMDLNMSKLSLSGTTQFISGTDYISVVVFVMLLMSRFIGIFRLCNA